MNAGDTPLDPVADLSTTGIDGWNFPQPGFTGQPIFGDITPVWFQARGPLDNGDPDWEAGDIVTHTSRPFVPNSNVTWTSDIAGSVDVTGSVWATREFGRTNDWFVIVNDRLLTSGTVSSGDPFDRDNPLPLEGGVGGAEALRSLPVVPGDVIKLEFEQRFGASLSVRGSPGPAAGFPVVIVRQGAGVARSTDAGAACTSSPTFRTSWPPATLRTRAATGVRTGLLAFEVDGPVTFRSSNFTDYHASPHVDDLTDFDATRNWWGSASGPSNPEVHDPSVHTPWATELVAGTSTPACGGGL